MDILQQIITRKTAYVEAKQKEKPLALLRDQSEYYRKCLSLIHQLQDQNQNGIIAEFKRKSPNQGMINPRAVVLDICGGYAQGGASALSVLTETDFFGGNDQDLIDARTLQLPILRKDFVIEPYQIDESKALGADVILLIASCLSQTQTTELALYAHSLELEVLLEIHDESELKYLSSAVNLVGINSRNLRNFEVNLETAVRLRTMVPEGYITIAESGVKSADDYFYLKQNGFSGFLIGTQFMQQEKPVEAFNQFIEELKQKI